MNRVPNPPNEPASPEVGLVITVLDRWVDAVPPAQRARLAAARAEAMAATDAPRAAAAHHRWMGSALAAGVLLALGLSFWPRPASQPGTAVTTAAAISPAEDSQQEDDLDLLLLVSGDDAS